MTIRDVAVEVLGSRKYSGVDLAVVERICAYVIPKYAKQKDVVKAVKKELHIIHESFLLGDCHTKAQALIYTYSGEDIKADVGFASTLMALHASTKERLAQAPEIYERIGKYIAPESCVIDIGCGFGPFALPFFTALPSNYVALDISVSTICTIEKYFKAACLPYRAQLCDAAAETPHVQGDVLLMLKLFPLLERQRKGRAFGIMGDLDCEIAIVSFPLKSASGKEKGMEAFYAARFEDALPQSFTIIEKVSFQNEMFYVLCSSA